MKKEAKFMSLAALLVLGACQREEWVSPEPARGVGEREVTVTAMLGGGTKTQLNGDGHVFWSPGDAISIFSAGEHREFVNQNTEPVQIAKFSGRASAITGASDGTAKDYIWGFYPYREDNEYIETEPGISGTAWIQSTLPSEQVGKAGTFNDGYAIAIGRSETLGISFQNLYSGFWFTVSRGDILSVTLSSEKPLSGLFVAGLDAAGKPEIKGIDEGRNSITMVAPGGGFFEVGKAYYFVTFPGEYESLTFSVRTPTLKGSRTIYDQELKRNDLSVGSKNLDKKIETSGTGFHSVVPSNQIWITTDQEDVAAVLPVGMDCTPSWRPDGSIALTFEEDVTEIPEWAFCYYDKDDESIVHPEMKSLLSVILPSSVTSIGDHAFRDCSSLERIEMDGVTSIGDWAFAGCESLSEVSIPESLAWLGGGSFMGTALTSVTVPGSAEIGSNPFQRCSALARFEGPFASGDGRCLIANEGVGSFAPAGLTSYSVPSGVKSIFSYAFEGCTELTSISLPTGLVNIGHAAFSGCNLQEITIPASVTRIGDAAFQVSGLMSVSLSEGLETIGKSAFYGCGMQEITIPGSVTSIGNGAFYFNANLQTVRFEADGTDRLPELGGPSVFAYCHNDLRLELPGSKAAQVSSAGDNWSALMDKVWAYQASDEVWAHGVSTNHLPAFLLGFRGIILSVESYTNLQPGTLGSRLLPVTEIPSSLSGEGILCLNYSEAILTVDGRAFEGMDTMDYVSLPAGVTCINTSAFKDCTALTSLNLPAVTVLGAHAFDGCTSLFSIEVPKVQSVGERCFDGVHQLSELSLPRVKTIGAGAFGAGSKLTTVTIGSSLDQPLTEKLFTYDEQPSGAVVPDLNLFMGKQTPPEISDDTFTGTKLKTVTLKTSTVAKAYLEAWSAYKPFSDYPSTILKQLFVTKGNF